MINMYTVISIFKINFARNIIFGALGLSFGNKIKSAAFGRRLAVIQIVSFTPRKNTNAKDVTAFFTNLSLSQWYIHFEKFSTEIQAYTDS